MEPFWFTQTQYKFRLKHTKIHPQVFSQCMNQFTKYLQTLWITFQVFAKFITKMDINYWLSLKKGQGF